MPDNVPPPLATARRRWRWRLLLLVALVAQGSAAGPAAPASTPGSRAAGVAPGAALPAVVPGRPMRFPSDFGAHPEHRIEWWYLTGRLDDGEQVRGFQITFFRLRPQWQEGLASPLAARQLLFAHAALADPRVGRLQHAERRARTGFGQVASEGDTAIRLGPWQLVRETTDGEQYRIDVEADGFAFQLRARPQGAPLLHGDAGYSRKGRTAERASYYYSRPQLAVDGTLTVGGRERPVRGQAWLDHEWSSALMSPDAVGWDWLGINLNDGSALMLFRMRNNAGEPIWAGGTRWQPGQPPRMLQPDEVAFVPRRRWVSARTGIAYPVELTVVAAGQTYRIRPLFDDQELDARASVGATYWEGAVVLDQDGQTVGHGYLELTGYAQPLRW